MWHWSSKFAYLRTGDKVLNPRNGLVTPRERTCPLRLAPVYPLRWRNGKKNCPSSAIKQRQLAGIRFQSSAVEDGDRDNLVGGFNGLSQRNQNSLGAPKIDFPQGLCLIAASDRECPVRSPEDLSGADGWGNSSCWHRHHNASTNVGDDKATGLLWLKAKVTSHSLFYPFL